MSRWLYPFERRVRRRRIIRAAVLLVVCYAVLSALDYTLFHALYVGPERRSVIEAKDWYRTLRVAGTLFPWLFIGGALWAATAKPDRGEGPRLLAAAALAGAAAELLQMLLGRLRPDATDGRHIYRGLLARFTDTHGLGLPSSHAAVAFGAAFMIAFLYPRAGAIALIAAAGCGLTRLLSGAHFSTDIFVAALVGYAIARLLRPGGWGAGREGLLLP